MRKRERESVNHGVTDSCRTISARSILNWVFCFSLLCDTKPGIFPVLNRFIKSQVHKESHDRQQSTEIRNNVVLQGIIANMVANLSVTLLMSLNIYFRTDNLNFSRHLTSLKTTKIAYVTVKLFKTHSRRLGGWFAPPPLLL